MGKVQLTSYTWQDLRETVHQVNPKLATIIDDLSPSEEFKLYRCAYKYGDEIVKRGDLYLPHQDGLVSLKSPEVSHKIRNDISYNHFSNPLSMVLNNAIEFHIPVEGRIIPHSLSRAGDIFGLGNIFDDLNSHFPPSFLWYMTAGARSVCMLSKISDSVSHRRLVHHYQIHEACPKALSDHWRIFRELVNCPEFGDPWEVDLLFFGQQWVKHLSDKAWIHFRAYLQDLVWQRTSYWRSQFISDLVLTHIQRHEGIKPSAYIADIVKYLFAVGVGALPGFMPAINNDLGPFDRVKTAYEDTYRMKEYLPIVMQPGYFKANSRDAVYASLQFLSVMELSPKSNERSSTIADLYAVQSLVRRYLRGITEGDYNMDGTWFYEMAKHVYFRFYHSSASQYPNIQDTHDLIPHDRRFQKLLRGKYGAAFPATGRFLRGCIQLASQ